MDMNLLKSIQKMHNMQEKAEVKRRAEENGDGHAIREVNVEEEVVRPVKRKTISNF